MCHCACFCFKHMSMMYDSDTFQGHKAQHNHSCRGSHWQAREAYHFQFGQRCEYLSVEGRGSQKHRATLMETSLTSLTANKPSLFSITLYCLSVNRVKIMCWRATMKVELCWLYKPDANDSRAFIVKAAPWLSSHLVPVLLKAHVTATLLFFCHVLSTTPSFHRTAQGWKGWIS